MPNYRRAWVPGGTYFFTVNLLERNRRLLVDGGQVAGGLGGHSRSIRSGERT
jgi:putative transposase